MYNPPHPERLNSRTVTSVLALVGSISTMDRLGLGLGLFRCCCSSGRSITMLRNLRPLLAKAPARPLAAPLASRTGTRSYASETETLATDAVKGLPAHTRAVEECVGGDGHGC